MASESLSSARSPVGWLVWPHPTGRPPHARARRTPRATARHRRTPAAAVVAAAGGRDRAGGLRDRRSTASAPAASSRPTTCWSPWPAEPLASGERREVRVRVWTDLGESDWSEPTALETGLLEDVRLVGAWVRPVEHAADPAGFRPAYLLRGEVHVPEAGRGRAAARHRTRHLRAAPQRRSASVTSSSRPATRSTRTARRCRPTTSPGWSPRAPTCSARCSPTGGTAARSACCAPPTSGATGPRCSPSCTSSTRTGAPPSSAPATAGAARRSHVLAADLIEGQDEDRRLVVDGWDEPGFDDEGWDAVEVVDHGYDALVASPAPPVRAVEELRPVVGDHRAPGRAGLRPRPEHQRLGLAGRPRACGHAR